MDILIVAMTSGSNPDVIYPIIKAYGQTQTTDACFIKAIGTN